jgi:leader peptidase (prepilin peptidase)/N-methyltransferase
VFEVLGAGACGLLAVVHPVPGVLAGWWLVVVGLALGYLDVTTYRLPNPLCLASYLGVSTSLALSAVADHDPAPLLRALLGGLLLAAAFLVLALASPAGMGLGDAKLAASLGTVLAWTSWSTLLTGTVLAFCLAAVPATITLLHHRGGPGREIAFGPYLLAGTLVALLTA